MSSELNHHTEDITDTICELAGLVRLGELALTGGLTEKQHAAAVAVLLAAIGERVEILEVISAQ